MAKERSINDMIPRSRITLTYRTSVEGKKKEVELPFRLLVMGDLTGRSFRKVPAEDTYDKRRIRHLDGTNLDEVMSDLFRGVKLPIEAKYSVAPDDERTLAVELTPTSTKALSPAELKNQVPQIRALYELRGMLQELVHHHDNLKKFRELMRNLTPEDVKKLTEEVKAKFGHLDEDLPALGAPEGPAALPPGTTVARS